MAYLCKYYKLTGKKNSLGTEYIQCTSPTCRDANLRCGKIYVNHPVTNYCFNNGCVTKNTGKLFSKSKETVTERCSHYSLN